MRNALWLALIAVLAAALRLSSLTLDLPTAPNIDEPYFVSSAARMASLGDWNPHWFGHPGSTVIYPLAILYRIFPGADGATGVEAAFVKHSTRFFLMGRLLSIFYGVLALWLVYLLVRRVTGPRAGLAAAAILAVNPELVTLTRLARTDGASLLFGTLALLSALEAFERPGVGRRLLAAVTLGLAIATKYYLATFGWILVLIVVRDYVLASGSWRREARSFAMSVLTASVVGATFLLATPYFGASGESLTSISAEIQAVGLPEAGSSIAAFGWYLTHGVPSLCGWLLSALALVGVAFALWRRRPLPLVLLGTLIVFLSAISCVGMELDRWLVPVLPIFAALAVDAVESLSSRLQRSSRAGFAAATLLLVVPGLVASLQDSARYRKARTPQLSREWAFAHLSAGSTILWEYDGDGWMTPKPIRHFYDGLVTDGTKQLRVLGTPPLAESPDSLARRRCEGVRYFALRGDGSGDLETLLADEAQLLARFPGGAHADGPTIRIFDLAGIRCRSSAVSQ